jgi:sialic acid synthase SpsE
MEIQIGPHTISAEHHPTYFIADISANHDGDLERAKMLIHLAKEAGADAAKFQNFRAPQIVSDYGFKPWAGSSATTNPGRKPSSKSTRMLRSPFEWTPVLKETCDQAGIDYFSSPYDFDAIDMLDPYVPGLQDRLGRYHLARSPGTHGAEKGKPVILATGASDIGDVQRAVHCILADQPAAWS